MFKIRAALFASLILASNAFAQDQPPVSLDPRLKIELFAENPQIVTPTGIDVDHAGRVWAIESNTHFPPEGYKGHPTDRVLVMEETDGDRKADKITVFKDGLTHTMSIAVKPVWLDIGRETRVESQTRRMARLFLWLLTLVSQLSTFLSPLVARSSSALTPMAI